ncbi:MAG: ribosome biogenesis GTPase Der [Polyangiaceae bacterium]|nr:ribosome biogenesis GTPase Der [Polyangiaceae bacterium]
MKSKRSQRNLNTTESDSEEPIQGDELDIPARPRQAPPSGVVALVGRPNVGKSTLFNRLIGKRIAIVHDEPGVTRDRHYGDAESYGRRYTLVDTGGFDPSSDDPMRVGIRRQIEAALLEADVVICVLDAREPATSVDHAEMNLLRAAQKPVIYVANKADSERHEAEASELYSLGIRDMIAVSALHGRGIDSLETAIVRALPPPLPPPAEPDGDAPIAVAIIGRPNAGKSSLVNRLAGKERMLVDDQPGTTRDPIDTLVERNGQKFLLIDTAGIRRKAKVEKKDDAVESMSVMAAVRTMERAEVVVLLCDTDEGVSEQDAKILGLAVDRGAGVVIGLNKTDLLSEPNRKKAPDAARDKLSFAPWAPLIQISAKTGRGVNNLLQTITEVSGNYRKRVPTGELNRFFEQVLANRAPPTSGGKAPRIYYVTQAETAPPLFVVVASDPAAIHFSYRRYIVNQLRKTFNLVGVPIRVKYVERRRRKLGEK